MLRSMLDVGGLATVSKTEGTALDKFFSAFQRQENDLRYTVVQK
jgi:hypothetical protein